MRADSVERRQARYGLDVDVTRRLGVVLAFLGRSEFKRSANEVNDDGLRNDTVIPTVGLEGTF